MYTKDNELKISNYEKKKGYMIGSCEFNMSL